MKGKKWKSVAALIAILLLFCIFAVGAVIPSKENESIPMTEGETMENKAADLEKETEEGNRGTATGDLPEEAVQETESEENPITEEETVKKENSNWRDTGHESALTQKEGAENGKAEEEQREMEQFQQAPLLLPKEGGASDIIVTTPATLFSFGGYRSVILSPDGHISESAGISTIPLHFHYGADGNTAFCLGVNLANPDTEVSYQEADLGEAYGDKLEQVSAIVQNSILKFSDDKKENALPDAWKHFTYEEAEYTAQLAIWKTLLGKPGNEPEMDGQGWFNDAWLYQNVYFPRMENLPGGKDIKGFYEYLLNTKTVAEPAAEVMGKEPVYADGFFEIPIFIHTKEASAGTELVFRGLSGEPKLLRSDHTEVTLTYHDTTDEWTCTFGGTVQDTLTLRLTASDNDEKTIQCSVYAKSNAVSSNLVYLIPSASHYQNLIKVEPKEVKTAEKSSDIFLPKVTADAEIKKIEKGTNHPIGNIPFHIWSDNGYDRHLLTDEDGICRMEGLLPGTYQYQEEEADGYVAKREIYTFTVEENGTVSGQVESGQTQFSVENLRYCDLTVVKKIKKEDIVWAHGNPTFLFSVSGTDLDGVSHTYYGCVLFTEENAQQEMDEQGYISLSYTFEQIPMGAEYAVEEERCNRYLLTDVFSEDENVAITCLEEPIYDADKKNSNFFEICVDLREKPTGTTVIFQNEKVRDDDYSDTSIAENRIPMGEKS